MRKLRQNVQKGNQKREDQSVTFPYQKLSNGSFSDYASFYRAFSLSKNLFSLCFGSQDYTEQKIKNWLHAQKLDKES